MAMLLDGPPSTIEDLGTRDSDLLTVAVAEGIDITAKLQVAAADIEMIVETMLLATLPSNGPFRRLSPELRHIAVTPQLKVWHIYTTLRLIYQDLYYTRLNDRYKAKLNMYREEELRMLEDIRTTGLGLVFDPLPQSPAPNVVTVQTGDAGGTLYIAVAFVNQRDEEGLISLPIEADTPDGSAATVTIAALADNAVGWNLYAGISPGGLTRQNARTLNPLASCTVAPGRLITGPKPAGGQKANLLHPVPRRISRG